MSTVPTVPVTPPQQDNTAGTQTGNIIQQILQQISQMSSLPKNVPQVLNQTQLPHPNLSPQIRPNLDLEGSGQEFRTKGGRQRAGMERLFGNAAKMVDAVQQNKEQKQLKSLSMDLERIYQAVAALDANPNDQRAKDTLNVLLDPQNKNFKKIQEVFDINFLEDKRDPQVVKANEMAQARVQAQGGGASQPNAAKNPMEIPSGVMPSTGASPASQAGPQPQPQAQPQLGAPQGQGGPQATGLNPAAQKFLQSFPQAQIANPNAAALTKENTEMMRAMAPVLSQVMRSTSTMDAAQIRELGANARAEFTQANETLRANLRNATTERGQDLRYKEGMARVNAELAKANSISTLADVTKYLGALRTGSQMLTQRYNALVNEFKAVSTSRPGDKATLDRIQKEMGSVKQSIQDFQSNYQMTTQKIPLIIMQKENKGGSKPSPSGGAGSVPEFTTPESLLNSYGSILEEPDSEEEPK